MRLGNVVLPKRILSQARQGIKVFLARLRVRYSGCFHSTRTIVGAGEDWSLVLSVANARCIER